MSSSPPKKLYQLKDRVELELCGVPWRTGGEASIYRLRDERVAKVFHIPPPDSTAARIRYLVENQPRSVASGFMARAWAWPNDVLMDASNGQLWGSVAPLLGDACPLGVLFDRVARESAFPNLTARHMPRIAANMMEAVEATHELGVILGDISPSNLLVTARGGIAIVDLESAQVTTSDEVFLCGVGTPDYLAPEIAKLPDYTRQLRDWRQDAFSLAVVTYQLLTGGVHCCDGGAQVAPGDWPLVDRGARITIGAWHASTRANNPVRILPPDNAIDYAAFGPELGVLFRDCFDAGFDNPSLRPRPAEWREALRLYAQELSSCSKNPRHAVHATLRRCPWCEVSARTGVDPFPISSSRRPQ